MYILRSNYSNNTMALIQWAYERQLENLIVLYIDTGWGGAGWSDYVTLCEEFVRSKGFDAVRIKAPKPFADLMLMKQGFPTRRYQWCSLHLKGIPFLTWIEERDPDSQATILIPRRNADGNSETPATEFIDCCEFHGNRKVWQPFYNLSGQARDELLQRAGLQPLPHPSLECTPCINSSVASLLRLTDAEIERTAELEDDLEQPLFNPGDCGGAKGIVEVVEWAQRAGGDALNYRFGCSAGFGCGS